MAAIGTALEMLGSDIGKESRDGIHFLHRSRRMFTVLVDDPANDTVDTALAASGVPQVPDPWPGKQYLICSHTSARRVSPIMFEITADYASLQGSLADINQSPIDSTPHIKFGIATSEEPLDRDIHGKPMVFKTGEQPEPKMRFTVEDDVIEVTRIKSYYNPSLWSSYRRSVNSDTFFGCPAGTVHLTHRSAESVTVTRPTGPFTYFKVTAQFQIRYAHPGSTDDKAWTRRVCAQGFLVLLNGVDKIGHAWSQGVPVTKPVPHDKNTGREILPRVGTDFVHPDDYQFYEFEWLYPKPYAALEML